MEANRLPEYKFV
jgi:leucyl aminopeptidase